MSLSEAQLTSVGLLSLVEEHLGQPSNTPCVPWLLVITPLQFHVESDKKTGELEYGLRVVTSGQDPIQLGFQTVGSEAYAAKGTTNTSELMRTRVSEVAMLHACSRTWQLWPHCFWI